MKTPYIYIRRPKSQTSRDLRCERSEDRRWWQAMRRWNFLSETCEQISDLVAYFMDWYDSLSACFCQLDKQ